VRAAEIKKMTGDGRFFELLEKGEKPAAIIADFERNNAAFKETRKKHLLY